MKDIKERELISYRIDDWFITTDITNLRAGSKGWYMQNGYIMRKVNNHPNEDVRGYVAEHRLIYERYLGRFLDKKEVIHHINGNRADNRLENLQIAIENGEHVKKYHRKARNDNGQFICEQPIFNEIKFRVFDKDRKITIIYTLNKLISTTFRRSKFEFRGRFTGLHDQNGKEIYEGDILKFSEVDTAIVEWNEKYSYFMLKPIQDYYFDSDVLGHALEYNDNVEVIGNIYENPELVKGADNIE
jgi:uncharacterized phage protein (TIGR01671 family)